MLLLVERTNKFSRLRLTLFKIYNSPNVEHKQFFIHDESNLLIKKGKTYRNYKRRRKRRGMNVCLILLLLCFHLDPTEHKNTNIRLEEEEEMSFF